MQFQFHMDMWNSVFAVPSVLVDKHIKLAEKEHLQVILWLLRHPGEELTLETIVSSLGLSQSVVEDAIDFWKAQGFLFPLSKLQSAHTPINEIPPARISDAEPDPIAHKRILPKPDTLHIATRIQESDELRYVIQDAEMTFGKTLSPAMTTTIVSIYDDYALPAEVIIMLIQYVKSIGKTSTAYLDAVARDWSQSNITSIQAAEQKLQELDQKRLAWAKVERITGQFHRSPSKREEEAADRWLNTWNFSDEMLQEAYERCVNQTGKFNVPYLNKVLEHWHQQGVRTPAEIDKLEQNKPSGKQKSYDISDLEDMSFFNPLEE